MSDLSGDLLDATRMGGEAAGEPEAPRTRVRKTTPVRKKRVTAEARRLAVLLLQGKQTDQRGLAQTLGVTTRSLQKWTAQSRSATPTARLGRRPHDEGRLADTERAIAALQEKTPRPLSWRMARQVLGAEHPTRLIQRVVGARKRAQRRAHEMALEDQRVHREILQGNAVWTIDATHIDRTENGTAIHVEVLSDVASGTILAAVVGPPSTDLQVAALLEDAIAENGPPCVLQSDNGGENRGPKVKAVLDHHLITHLRNVPHTPEHNAVGERANGLLKETLGIRKRDPPRHLPIRVWQSILDHVCHWMNTAFRRQSRGGKTPQDFHDALHTWYPALSREDFYAAARSAVEHAAKSHSDPCALRNADAAIIDTMESFGILRRTRGRARIPIPRCEGIS